MLLPCVLLHEHDYLHSRYQRYSIGGKHHEYFNLAAVKRSVLLYLDQFGDPYFWPFMLHTSLPRYLHSIGHDFYENTKSPFFVLRLPI